MLSNIDNGTMNSSTIWQRRDDACSNVETSEHTLAALQRECRSSVQPLKKPTDKNDAYPYGTMNFHSRIGNLFPNSQQLYEVSFNFKGLSQHGEGADFSKNLCASLLNDDLSNEPNFGSTVKKAIQYIYLQMRVLTLAAAFVFSI